MKYMKNEKVVVLMSGGIDSTTCLALAREHHSKENVIGLSLFYGQKHEKELISAREVAKFYGIKLIEHDISSVMKFSNCPLLANSTEKIKHESYAEQLKKMGGSGTVDTYVPFRNGVLISIAASIALQLGASAVIYGAHADDAAGRAYPDCTPEFVDNMRNAIKEGTAGKVTLCAPLLFWNKAEVVLAGSELGAPYKLTWSCYEGGDKPCGTCGTCIDRAAAFAKNGLVDPALEEE